MSLVALRIFVHGEPVELLDSLQPAENAPLAGRNLAKRLRELLPAQSFDIPIQAKVGGRVVARETVRAIRNDVTAKCVGFFYLNI